MNNYLAKPVKPNTLKALLESYLSKADGASILPERPKAGTPDTSAETVIHNQAATNGAAVAETTKDVDAAENMMIKESEPAGEKTVDGDEANIDRCNK